MTNQQRVRLIVEADLEVSWEPNVRITPEQHRDWLQAQLDRHLSAHHPSVRLAYKDEEEG